MSLTPSFSKEYNISDIFQDYKPQKKKEKENYLVIIIIMKVTSKMIKRMVKEY